MESWKNGMMENKEMPLNPIFQYSSIPGCLLGGLCVLCGEKLKTARRETRDRAGHYGV
jgi:hypothetical protein